ncbi:2-dehydro-3-deoxy-6-phosphogalactonate aldolase [Vibrio sp. CyArs1]|uniref:2-dehydro-3-deoxy-6-phosphogalactonate aldolase n=1 Tax=Vibrio sp. CyArs1 TaxID=2682577 RepID=UPI001F0544BF|nr:2-dehydro-3-deoxy-6-phosphogalactonate aldolase [Vibrio sp. CyArs1]
MKYFDLSRHLPLIAILRGIEPDDVVRVASLLKLQGFSMIEVPLNSPNALESIRLLVTHFDLNDMLIGAGTVTNVKQAQDVIATGANLVVTPNMNPEVIQISRAAGCAVFPGVVTPTEAFDALAAGATGLKLFPISALRLDGFRALLSVLPEGTPCMPVGSIDATEDSMYPFMEAGAVGFGLGSALYKPNMSDVEIEAKAQAFVSIFRRNIGRI